MSVSEKTQRASSASWWNFFFGSSNRYRLSRLFFNFYLMAMGTFIAIAMMADFIINAVQGDIIDDYARRFMNGTISLVEKELNRYPRGLWQEQITQIGGYFSYDLQIVERISLDSQLSPEQIEILDDGETAIDFGEEMLYRRLGNSSLVLVVGPLTHGVHTPWMRHWPFEYRMRLMTWSLMGLIFAVVLLFWIRPVWRDLNNISTTAHILGDGQFERRNPPAESALFMPLSLMINNMANRIQQLVCTHRELSSGISHELRTPLARLRFAVDMLPDEHDQEKQANLWHMVSNDLDELDHLIDTSLTYARWEREAVVPHFSQVKVAQWLCEEVDALRVLAPHLQIQCDLVDLPKTLIGDIDRRTVPYAVRNLLRNAFKYANKRVVVHGRYENGRVSVYVDDDGVGISEEDRERIFSAFTRLDRSRDRDTGGYGLGLAITRRAIHLHNGEVRAESSPLGGARFILDWPLLQSHEDDDKAR